MLIYLNGLMLGLSLITTLGPQNIFLIRQGAMRNHAVLSAITCFISDVLLITASVIGLQGLLEMYPALKMIMTWFGALFLVYYGIAALKRGFSKTCRRMGESSGLTRKKIMVLALSFSLLNPHAIIDSLVLIGGGSAQFPGHETVFLLGVLSSSLLWFTLLTLTTYYFSTGLSRPGVWRSVECGGGILMILLSLKLGFSQF
jgi:L-lysine exporter family protein LysE/ArgO